MRTLGFDTSNYTTSAALYDTNNVINARQLLDVKNGERGLRQSDALFQHIKQFPEVIKSLGNINDVCAVGVSIRPRSVNGSYMPVFLAGLSVATTAASCLNVPLYEFSHQDGHIMAAIISSKAFDLLSGDFLAVHISGGTTEILKTSYNGCGFNCEIVGGTKDISAGQVIDRVGVAIGMKFPCGKEFEKLSLNSTHPRKLPVSHNEGFFNFSGLETQATKYVYEEQADDLAAGVILAISKTLADAISYCSKSTRISRVLVVGGVASNLFIRNYLNDNTDNIYYFATPDLSSDNACGVAALAYFAQAKE